ncbi:MAG TPA: DUF885 domain-containing protein [Steroidobacteraceae bacterium]
MKHVLTVFAVLVGSTALAQNSSNASAQLHALFEEAWEQDLADDPRWASHLGDERFNARWADHSLAAFAERDRRYRNWIAAADRIDPEALSDEDRLNRDLFKRLYQERVDRFRFKAHLRAIDQLNYSGNVLTANELTEVIQFDSVRDYEDWLARLETLDRYVDETIALVRAGIRERNVQPRIIVERVAKQIEAHLVDDPTRSSFYQPFTHFPDTVPGERRKELQDAARNAISKIVVPAYRRLQEFIEREYLPASRTTVGIWDSPNGAEYYANRVRWFTTTNLTPQEVHEIGLKEVERIRAEMQAVLDRVGFRGSFAEFLRYLRTDPQFRLTSPDELFKAYMVMAKRIDPLLTDYFGTLPRTPYGVRAIPEANAPDTTTAYYQPPSSDGRRPGYYYVNLYRPEERPTYEIPVLTAHEAVPGHHLQQAIAMEQGELPKFRRMFDATAYVEGWALYAESLADEMGLYTNPYDKFGQLTYEMWRAVRLVVDTGMHYKRWTREQAIEFFRANAAKSELDIVNEIDRYIAWPGQATAYKIGELKIKELRQRAASRLGARFDLRQFHDEVLRGGAVPLDVLERRIDAWIARQAASDRPAR